MLDGKSRKLDCLIWDCQRGDLGVWLLEPSMDRDQSSKILPFYWQRYMYYSHTGLQRLGRIRQIPGLWVVMKIEWCVQMLILLFILNTYFWKQYIACWKDPFLHDGWLRLYRHLSGGHSSSEWLCDEQEVLPVRRQGGITPTTVIHCSQMEKSFCNLLWSLWKPLC